MFSPMADKCSAPNASTVSTIGTDRVFLPPCWLNLSPEKKFNHTLSWTLDTEAVTSVPLVVPNLVHLKAVLFKTKKDVLLQIKHSNNPKHERPITWHSNVQTFTCELSRYSLPVSFLLRKTRRCIGRKRRGYRCLVSLIRYWDFGPCGTCITLYLNWKSSWTHLKNFVQSPSKVARLPNTWYWSSKDIWLINLTVLGNNLMIVASSPSSLESSSKCVIREMFLHVASGYARL